MPGSGHPRKISYPLSFSRQKVEPLTARKKRYIGISDAAKIIGVDIKTVYHLMKRKTTALGFVPDVHIDKKRNQRLLEADAHLLKLGVDKGFLRRGVRPCFESFNQYPEPIQKACLERPTPTMKKLISKFNLQK